MGTDSSPLIPPTEKVKEEGERKGGEGAGAKKCFGLVEGGREWMGRGQKKRRERKVSSGHVRERISGRKERGTGGKHG